MSRRKFLPVNYRGLLFDLAVINVNVFVGTPLNTDC